MNLITDQVVTKSGRGMTNLSDNRTGGGREKGTVRFSSD
jgi:hypothetical protein